MNINKRKFGAAGESLAVNFLTEEGYNIICKNYSTRFGEIDIVAKDEDYIVFIEVKTRTKTEYGRPCQAVNFKKQKAIGKVAALYILNNKLTEFSCRFDIIEVLLVKGENPKISHLIDAFQPSVF